MDNPWKHISLDDYEEHMKLDSVMQLQVLNQLMKNQLHSYDAHSVMILGVAGGNGLEHIDMNQYQEVYGVDINEDYLSQCKERYPKLRDVFIPILADITEAADLPHAKVLIANLLIEYVGYKAFQKTVRMVEPSYVSCVIQKNTEVSFVSESPYLHCFDGLEGVHHQIEEENLNKCMDEIGWKCMKKEVVALPNGKSLIRLDYKEP